MLDTTGARVSLGHDGRSQGATESFVKWAKERIDESGYLGTKVVLKSDQEEAIKALKRAIAVKRQEETISIESPARDSK